MSTFFARGVVVLGILVGILEVVAALSPFGRAPLRLHDWWVLPVACVELRCVTYRQWAVATRVSGSPNEKAPEVLTHLLTNKVSALVARRSGLGRVPDEEVDAALGVLRTTTASDPSIEAFLKTRAVDLRSAEFRGAMRDLLAQGKLAAAGITDVWTHPTAPSVKILHTRYRWDVVAHQVKRR